MMESHHTEAKTLAARMSKIALWATYFFVFVMAALVIWQVVERQSEQHVVAWAVGAIFVGIAVPLSFHEVHMHLLHWESPLQRYYCRILLMVPIYSLESWCALRFKQQAVYFAVAREAYEALVIRDFFRLLMDALSHGSGDPSIIAAKARALGKREAHMIPPFCISCWGQPTGLMPWRLDQPQFYTRIQACVFQYVVVRLVMTVAVLIAELSHTYGEGEWTNPHVLFPYAAIVINVSQFIAMWALVQFYHETADMLAPLHPFGKFLAVKSVVFLSFWQGILISGLVESGVITESPAGEWSGEEVGTGLQQFLICIEMAGAAVAHHYTFNVQDFWTGRYKEGSLAAPEDGGMGGMTAVVPNAAYGAAVSGAGMPPASPGGTSSATPVKPQGIGAAAAQLLPHDIIQEAGQHASALTSAVGASMASTVQNSRALRAQMMGRAPAVWSTSSAAGGAAEGGGGDSSTGSPAGGRFKDEPSPRSTKSGGAGEEGVGVTSDTVGLRPPGTPRGEAS